MIVSLQVPCFSLFLFSEDCSLIWILSKGFWVAIFIFIWSNVNTRLRLLDWSPDCHCHISFSDCMANIQRWQPLVLKSLVWHFHVSFTSLHFYAGLKQIGRECLNLTPRVGKICMQADLKVFPVHKLGLLITGTNLKFIYSQYDFYTGDFSSI